MRRGGAGRRYQQLCTGCLATFRTRFYTLDACPRCGDAGVALLSSNLPPVGRGRVILAARRGHEEGVMQYLLTEEELAALRAGAERERARAREALQKACTLAADHVPVVLRWSPDKTPRAWGCILTGQAGNFGYCDDCPVKDICPHDKKRWSK